MINEESRKKVLEDIKTHPVHENQIALIASRMQISKTHVVNIVTDLIARDLIVIYPQKLGNARGFIVTEKGRSYA